MRKIATLARATGPLTTKVFGPTRPRARVTLPPATPATARIQPDFSDIPIPAGVEGPVRIVEGYEYKVNSKGVLLTFKEQS